jgi:hypothetical protein
MIFILELVVEEDVFYPLLFVLATLNKQMSRNTLPVQAGSSSIHA